jgi:hypothetical protein
MSAFIGNSRGPHNNSPEVAAEVWCSLGGVELHLLEGVAVRVPLKICRSLDPIAARNLAALLVRASEEVERMRVQAERENRTPLRPGEEA